MKTPSTHEVTCRSRWRRSDASSTAVPSAVRGVHTGITTPDSGALIGLAPRSRLVHSQPEIPCPTGVTTPNLDGRPDSQPLINGGEGFPGSNRNSRPVCHGTYYDTT